MTAADPKPSGRLTLSESDRKVLALWTADCAERSLKLFLDVAPHDKRPADAIAGARAFAHGELRIGETRKLAVAAHAAAREVHDPAAVAAARAAGHATATSHMASHATWVAYSALAFSYVPGSDITAAVDEINWQIAHASHAVRQVMQKLPPKSPGKTQLLQLIQQLQLGLAPNP